MNETTSTSTELVPVKVLTPATVFAPGGVEAIISKVEMTARKQAAGLDISRPKDRAAMKSLARKVASSKVVLDEMGKTLSDEHRKAAEAIFAERRVIRDRLDALSEEVRKPLTDWEDAEKRRVAEHEAAIDELNGMLIFDPHPPMAAQIRERIAQFEARPARVWQEFVDRASKVADQVGATLDHMLREADRVEAEREELARLRREQAEREQRERDERIAREAAERARQEAAAAARAEQERVEREARQAAERAAAEQRRVEDERAAAERRAVEAENARLAAVAKAEADAKTAAERAERDRLAAAEAAERAKAAAIEAERKRIADEQAAADAEARRREADKSHRARINNDAMAGLVAAGLSDADAKSAIVAIALGRVQHVRISY